MFKYSFLKTIGSGATGSVFLALDKDTHDLYAIKKCSFPMQREEISKTEEDHYLTELVHPNIVSCRESFIVDSTLYIVMDYARAGDLYMLINGFLRDVTLFPESVIRAILHDSLSALGYIHDHGIIHRDIKPSNILLFDDGKTKVCDFGIAQSVSIHTSKCKGTLQYMAPEVVNRGSYSSSSDVWSLGCVLYELIWKKPLFSEGSYSELVFRIVDFKSVTCLEFPPIYSSQLCAIIKSMLSIKPEDRPTVKDLLDCEYLKTEASVGRSLLRHYAKHEIIRNGVKSAIESLSIEQKKPLQQVQQSVLQQKLLSDPNFIQKAIKAFNACNQNVEYMEYNVSGYRVFTHIQQFHFSEKECSFLTDTNLSVLSIN